MSKTKKENVIARTFAIARQGRAFYFFSCLSSVVGMVLGIVPYLSVYYITRQILMPQPQSDSGSVIALWALVAGLSIVLNMVFSFLGSVGCHKTAFRVLYNFRVKVMEHIGKLSIGFFSTHTTGSVQKTMDENIEKIEGYVAHMLPDILGSAAIIIILIGSLFKLNIWLAAVVLLAIGAALTMQMLVFGGKKAKQLWVDVATASKEMTGNFSEYVKGMAEVKLFGLVGTMTGALEGSINKYRTWELRQYKRSSVPMSAYKTVVLSLLTFIVPVAIVLIIKSPTQETMLAVLMALIITPAIYDPLTTCINYGSQAGSLAIGLDSIDEILDIEPVAAPRKAETPTSWDVRFENVSFSYQDASDPLRKMALQNIDFTAPQGKFTALVGPSGGGKSTVGQLLSRFWDIDSGAIYIGGVDIRQIAPDKLMDYVAVVFQDTYIFSDTIMGNITMNRNYAKDEIEAATKAAQCHDFIMNLPKGYETRIGTGGARLSGGEAQRVSIARAILKGSPIVLLDEALAYSDAENENLIQKAIQNLLQDKTVIVIAHRLQSIQRADQILVLQQGRIIEEGSYASLMKEDTEFRTLWELQHQADEWTIKTETATEGGVLA